jgi:hypothetical protein
MIAARPDHKADHRPTATGVVVEGCARLGPGRGRLQDTRKSGLLRMTKARAPALCAHAFAGKTCMMR